MVSEMALISPTKHASLRYSESKICHQPSLACHCLIKGDTGPSCHTLLRQGPGFSLSVSPNRRQHRKMALMYSWLQCHAKRSSPHMVGSWMDEAYNHLRPCTLLPARDDRKILKCRKSDSLASKQLLSDLIDKAELFLKDTDNAVSRGLEFDRTYCGIDHPVEEPWLLESSLISQNGVYPSIAADFTNEESIHQGKSGASLKAKSSKKSKSKNKSRSKRDASNNPVEKVSVSLETSSELDQPVEEPWLLESFIFLGSDADLVSEKGTVEDEAAETESCDKHPDDAENLLHEEENNAVSKANSVSTVILINSSVCTVQRIAVLEDGNLVELLLEPVKTNVQSNSVYLGVVTKFVPHMGGAFVNIGSPRPSLMDIKNNREPFVFPPYHTSAKVKEPNGSAVSIPEEQLGDDGILNNSYNVEVVDEVDDEADDDSVGYLHDEYADHDTEDDFDIQEFLKENVNGSLPRQDEVDAAGRNTRDKEGFSSSHLQNVKEHNDACKDEISWGQVRKGTKIIVQVVKEGLGTKGPTLTAYPKLKSRFWILSTRCSSIGISKKISGVERTRLRVIAKTLQPDGFGLTVRTVAAGHSIEELQKDLKVLLSTWKDIMEHAKSSALAADEGVEGAIPVMLHRAMGQTLSVVQDYFNEKVKSMIVDSPRTYHEITNYLEEIAPDLCDRVELFDKRTPLFDEYNIEEEINNILSKRVPLDIGGYLVIEQTEALVSIDVNGGQCMLGQGTSQEKAILNVNLAAAKQIARELRLRDIGGIIVVDFIDMLDDANKRLVYEEVKKSVERDRSTVKVSELSRHGLMEITRKRVRPSVTFMISEPCNCCHATGRVEALETSFSKIEHEICRLLATMNQKPDPENPKSWPKFILQVDRHMCNYLTAGKRTKLAFLSSSLKVWLILKVARGFTRGSFELKPLTGDKDKNNNNNYQKVAVSLLRRTEAGSYTPNRKVTVFPIKKWKTTGRK